MTLTELSGFDLQKPLHAYLIVSSGLLTAREYATSLAAALICESPSAENGACGLCSACKKTSFGSHPDIFMLGQGSVSVNDIRDLREKAHLAPNEGERKIFILENIGAFNVQSQNALLKILEEPPKNVFFILTATSKNTVLPTVLSRVCTLTPCEHDTKYYKNIILKSFGSNVAEDVAILAARYLECYGITNTDSMSADMFEKAYSLAIGYLSGTERDIISRFPKTREAKNDEISVYLRIFMLISHNVVIYKLSGGKLDVTPMNDEFRKICVRLSAKKALSYYEMFEKAYLLYTENANINALYSYLSEKL